MTHAARDDRASTALTPDDRRAEHVETVERVLPQRSGDEVDEGWGDRTDDADRDAWYQRERPPHHE